MICIEVRMRHTGEPFKRTPVTLQFDTGESLELHTDRDGRACTDHNAASGKVLIDGRERHHGLLDGDIRVEIWSLVQAENHSSGAPSGLSGGSIAYPNMQTRDLLVEGRVIQTDSEGYIVNPGEWSEAFARAQADAEELTLDEAHWEVIRYLREFFEEHNRQAAVRDMVKHFRERWGRELGSSTHLHRMFPRGGPQKQGNRLAGLLRTKGEH
ncbi:MAG: TusE/DsrC/DsvC family sulfur relay protein [Chromatiales bacterium]|nr:TusE/DsrC/DsvC family sulfur relay protein [Gammaproteobacteria bacterium]MCP5351619.1 TusE/DsrC/DsvC family sulfur relay protein [Chromatiales bacterium]